MGGYPEHSSTVTSYKDKPRPKDPPLIKIKVLCEKGIEKFYDRLWVAIEKSWKFVIKPLSSILYIILIPPFMVFIIIWELIRRPVSMIWNYLEDEYRDRDKGDENEEGIEPVLNAYFEWYKDHRMESFAMLGFLATGCTLALAFIFAQTLLLGDIDFSLNNSAISPEVTTFLLIHDLLLI